ncbi:DNA polymerase [Pseudorhodoplanes sp.]|uniref:DNA polymerase n=1 Tax=Pseudorhodoplanes sp. TaxID=1934341 RepID=UPI003D0C1786
MPKLRGVRRPPYPTGPLTLIVTIDAQLLAGCHLALGWRMPERIIDLKVEFHNDRSVARAMVGGLAGALAAAGQPATMGLLSGTSPAQMRGRLDAVARLFASKRDSLDLGRSLLRGRYLCAVARIEAAGLPVDGELIKQLRMDWSKILERVISNVDESLGVYRGCRLDETAFSHVLERHGIDWPHTATGALTLDDATFREMSRLHRVLCPIKQLRATMIGFDPSALAIGRDERNRTPLRPFASQTGRNQPRAKASVLGSAGWVRHLILPAPGTGLAMLDWQQQEFGIAAALSGDGKMQAAYRSGDPYLALAVTAGAVPAGGTGSTHSHERERFKRCALGLQYGIGRARLARQLGIPESVAAAMIDGHRSAFPRFWAWLDAVEMRALADREMRSVFGWRLPIDAATNPRSIRNFPMQANGAEMLRLACCLMTEAGIRVCAPNHDAVVIEAPLADLDEVVSTAKRLMGEASTVVLGGFSLRASVRTVRGPDRWSEPKGQAMWSAVLAALGKPPAHQRDATCASASPRPI